MLLLAAVINSGTNVPNRFELEGVVAGAISDTGFDDLSTLGDLQEWATESFFPLFEADEGRGGNVFLNTYNRMVGAIRVEVLRIDPRYCSWKVDGWRDSYRLGESFDGCFGWLDMDSADNVCAHPICSVPPPMLCDLRSVWPEVRLVRVRLVLPQRSFGPNWDDERYGAEYRYGEYRYHVDIEIGSNQEFAAKRLQELMDTGFVDELRSRIVRLKLLTYNSALTMFCSLSMEASLSPTGVLRTGYKTSSFPAQEYMPHTVEYRLVLEGLLVVWTFAQLLKEFIEMVGEVRESGAIVGYFLQPFNFLDWLRFGLFLTAMATRYRLFMDESRGTTLETTVFVDTEEVELYNRVFDLLTCYLTIISLLSTIQYFALTERTDMLKGTLAKVGTAMSTFILVFLLFFLVYSVIGSYLLGSSLEAFSTFDNAFHNSFEMMNANLPFEEVEAATDGSVVQVLTVAFYYYSFIILHYLLLLNVIIAIVVEAYMEVQEERGSAVNKIFRNNQGSLSSDLATIWLRRFKNVWLVLYARLNPMSLVTKTKNVFIAWDDDAWLNILEQVIEERRAKGVPSRGTTLAALRSEVKKLPKLPRTIADRIANARLNPLGERAAPEDQTFRQVTHHFFHRKYWISPANLAEPLDNDAQPPKETWKDCTLERVAMQVQLLDRRSITLGTTLHLLQNDITEIRPRNGLVESTGSGGH